MQNLVRFRWLQMTATISVLNSSSRSERTLTTWTGKHCVFGEVAEGHDVLEKLSKSPVDKNGRPLQDICILHTVFLMTLIPIHQDSLLPAGHPVHLILLPILIISVLMKTLTNSKAKLPPKCKRLSLRKRAKQMHTF